MPEFNEADVVDVVAGFSVMSCWRMSVGDSGLLVMREVLVANAHVVPRQPFLQVWNTEVEQELDW